MARNVGKIFEDQIKASIPEYVLFYKLPDAAQSFGTNEKLRFSRKSPFDQMAWDSHKHILYALELKTVQGKSISFERNKDENGEIHYHQIKELNDWNKYDGTVCGFIIEFRELEKTIFFDIESFNWLSNKITKKSFTIEDIENNGLSYVVIPQKIKRTRYTYDMDSFFSQIKI